MTTLSRLAIALTLLLAPASALAAEPAKAKPAPTTAVDPAKVTLDQAIDGVHAFYSGVTDFKARFRQTMTRKHLPRPLKKSGMVYFKKPGMMRWDYTQPDKVYYVSDGEILWSYEPAEKVVYKLDVRESELYSALKFLVGQGDLRAEFDVALLPPRDGMVVLALTPKRDQSNYKQLRLMVSPDRFEIRGTELVDPLDNVSHIVFEDASYDALKPEGFKFQPPKGVRVEDLEGRGAGRAGDAQ
ncbi:MAG: outer membrane lipoprotein chaperone LolA [Deltaproteobacteria bacterium]|nr:outer membrane lipoprotein chaperone LolA [Deltaproteobacteria bacterium]MCB9787400.1 outer membrane lipoprotein chaperone LolA [Deltaproteobacteria bacterium]